MTTTSMRLLGVCTVVLSLAASFSYAQEKSTTSDIDMVKTALLRPDGWTTETRSPLGDGTGYMFFISRGENIVVKMHNDSMNMTCERSVVIASGEVRMDGCYSKCLVLTYDPNDGDYPFKGGNENVDFKLKPK